ncbi:hypothetical protein [Luteimonas soli]|uniref:hypothetical protein n=1 Tax=Luteimonas soli TaxID=1648966 RepID=UPI0036DB851C
MGRTGRVDPGHVFACVLTIVAHMFLWWMVARKIVLPSGETGGALQVTWIEPSLPSPPPPATEVRPDAMRTSAPHMRAPRTPSPAEAQVEAHATPPAPGKAPMSAVFIEQGRELSRAAIDADAFAADPLAHRAARLPGPGTDAFRMREPISAERVLRAIGGLVAGPGYTTDPCARVASNIQQLSQSGDSELLQEELRRKRALCD